jgi:uncharacterized protein
MGSRIDLGDVPVVDNHCHPIEARQSTEPETWRDNFTESPDARMRSEEAANTVFYRRLIRAMATFHGVEATEEAVLRARGRLLVDECVGALFSDAAIAGSSSTPVSQLRRLRSRMRRSPRPAASVR